MKQKFLQLIFPVTVLGVIYIGTSSYSNNFSIISGASQTGCGGGGCHGASIPALCNISVTGFPDGTTGYNPGSVYPITINISAAGKLAAGINISVSTGSISNLGSGLTLVNGTSARHTSPKNLTASATTYTFNWTAPNTLIATASLYIAANGVNLNGGTGGDAWNVYSTSVPLSANPLKFETSSKANEVTLNWETTKEIDLDYFVVERSIDGNKYDSLTVYKALGNVNIGRNYLHKDHPHYTDDYYYRLKLVTLSGTYSYSQVKKVSFNNGAKFEVIAFPNPNSSSEQINLNVFNNRSETLQVTVSDVKGLVIYNQTVTANEGTNYLHINRTLPAGLHMISVTPKNGAPYLIKHLTN